MKRAQKVFWGAGRGRAPDPTFSADGGSHSRLWAASVTPSHGREGSGLPGSGFLPSSQGFLRALAFIVVSFFRVWS